VVPREGQRVAILEQIIDSDRPVIDTTLCDWSSTIVPSKQSISKVTGKHTTNIREADDSFSSAVVDGAKANRRASTPSRATTREVFDEANVEVAPRAGGSANDRIHRFVGANIDNSAVLSRQCAGEAEKAHKEQGDGE
jgi:hypothetical protein